MPPVERSPRPRLPTDIETMLAEVAARAVEMASESADSATKLERGKHVRNIVLSVLGAIATCGGGSVGVWKLAGPEQATERAETAATKADEKTQQLEALRTEMEKDRRSLVDGRLDRVETRVGSIEGRIVGQDVKLDRLLEHELGSAAADKVKASAEKVAAEVEGATR